MSGILIAFRNAAGGFRALRKRSRAFAHTCLASLLGVFGLSFLGASAQAATTNSNRLDVALQASVVQSITLAVANPAVAFGIVTPGTSNVAPAGQSLAITTAWNLGVGQTVKLYAYFDSASSAMTGTLLGDVIPASSFTGSFNGGAYQSFSQTSPFTSGATALNLYSVSITSTNSLLTARLDTLTLAMNLTGVSLHADTYVGVMHLQAQAL